MSSHHKRHALWLAGRGPQLSAVLRATGTSFESNCLRSSCSTHCSELQLVRQDLADVRVVLKGTVSDGVLRTYYDAPQGASWRKSVRLSRHGRNAYLHPSIMRLVLPVYHFYALLLAVKAATEDIPLPHTLRRPIGGACGQLNP